MSAPDTPFTPNTISVCTNDAKNNYESPISNNACVGKVPSAAGTVFNVTV